jgi:membrane-bound serine protease (ClpP class)
MESPIFGASQLRRLLAGSLIFLGTAGLLLPAWGGARADQAQSEIHDSGGSADAEGIGVERIGAILPIRDMITDITAESLQRRITLARDLGARVIVFEMDTPGGLVTSSIAVADLIRELTDIKTVAWVNPTAHSGGALVAVACDEIIMTRSSRIGDAQVIMGGPGGAGAVPEELQPKAYTPVLADFRQSAKLNGYSQVLCEAFVLPDREVWWIENVVTGERRFVFTEEKNRLLGSNNSRDKDETQASGYVPIDQDDPGTLGAVRQRGAFPRGVAFQSMMGASIAIDDIGDNPVDDTTQDVTADVATNVSNQSASWKLVEKYFDPLLEMEVDAIQPVVRDDQLLEMSAGEATAYGFCKAVVSSEEGVRERYDLTTLVRFEANWSENLALWLTSIYVRGFLMLIILLGAYVEFHTPGVGVPGAVALIALAIFVGAPYLTGLASTWEILAIAIGIVLIAVEVLVIPGFTLAGIAGIALFMLGLLATFVPDEPDRPFPFYLPSMPGTIAFLKQGLITFISAMTASVIGMVILSRYLPKTGFFRRIVPANPTPSDVLVVDEYMAVARVGDVGVSETALRPAGKATFGSTMMDVVTQGEYLDRGAKVEVIEHRGNRVVVRAIQERGREGAV